MALRLKEDEVQQRFKSLYNGEYELVGKYVSNNSKSIIRHKECGNTFSVSRLTRFFNQSKDCPCPYCRDKTHISKMTKEVLEERIKKYYNSEFDIIELDHINKIAILMCKKCKTIFKKQFKDIGRKNGFGGCPNCHISKRGKHQVVDDYLEKILASAIDGSEYEWKEEYKNKNNIKHLIFHKKCGNIYSVRPGDFVQGYRCPYCARKRSNVEKEFSNKIKEIFPDIKTSDRSVINPYELDIYIPSKKIGIEFNGLFWHCEDKVGKNYHEKKRKICEEKGIRLIQIFEDEWNNHEDIVISKIKNILKISNLEKIYARNCICKKIEKFSEYSDFLEKNHIQGSTPTQCIYGLYFKDKLIAVAGFNKLRSSMNKNKEKNAWDMIRYATDINYSVVGGFSKILSHFVKNENCKYLKTIADLRWSDLSSNIYLNNGFIKENYIPPRYFYTDFHNRFPRFDFRKDKIKEKFPEIYDESKTEFEMMDKTKFKRIWDAGKITYSKKF